MQWSSSPNSLVAAKISIITQPLHTLRLVVWEKYGKIESWIVFIFYRTEARASMSAGPHTSLSAEPIYHLGEFVITNSIFTSLIVSALLILFALAVRLNLKKTNRPTGLQSVAEWIVESLYAMVHSVTENHQKTGTFLPFLATFFLFILFNNWFGLLPGVGTIGFVETEKKVTLNAQSITLPALQVQATTEPEEAAPEAAFSLEETDMANESTKTSESEKSHDTFVPLLRAGTADLNTTLALALISVIMTQVWGVKYLHLSYFKKYLNFSNPMTFIVGLLEFVLECAKILSFAFRLFGNIFAGEVLLAVMSFLVPLFVPIPFYGLEVFVGFIQALVFTMLSLVFFNMATVSHDEH